MSVWFIVLALVIVVVIVILLIAWGRSRDDVSGGIERAWDDGARRGNAASNAARNDTNRILRR